MNLQLTPALERQLSEVAQANDCSPEQIAGEAIERYLSEETEHLQILAERRAEVVAGHVLEHSEVWDRLQELLRHQ